MEQDVFEIQIAIVTVGTPATSAQIHFHVAGAWCVVANLQNRPAKIRPAFKISEAGMKNADASPVCRFQLASPQPLMLPDGLDEPLGGKRPVTQGIFFTGAHTIEHKNFPATKSSVLLFEF
jgi:hypothetical protein